MISAKNAMDSISSYIREFSQYIPSSDVRLEEIEPDESKNEWVITLSYPENPLMDTQTKRAYKTFRVDGTFGKVISMKNTQTELPF